MSVIVMITNLVEQGKVRTNRDIIQISYLIFFRKSVTSTGLKVVVRYMA